MAGSALLRFHGCTASHHDHDYFQLQLPAPPEVTTAGVVPSLRTRRKNRPCISVVGIAAKPCCLHSEDASYALCSHSKLQRQNRSRAYVFCTVTPLLDRCEGRPFAFAMQETSSYKNRRNYTEISIVCAMAKPMLDRCSNDANDAILSEKSSASREEVLSALQRSLLEGQWALQSAQRFVGEEECLKSENSNCKFNPQQSASAVVRSGQASARQRRLSSRLKSCASSSQNSEGSLKGLSFAIPTKLQGKRKRSIDPLQDFISSFLRPTNGCELITKDQERGYTREMRICQNLEKAKRELKKRLGYDPSYELWAESVHISTEELLSMVNKGEIARNKMLFSHLRLVVAVAKHYQNLGVDMNDLIQEGSIGLLRGLEKFDHRKGYKLSTYVHWWIRQGVTRAIADHSRMVRVPVYLHEIMFAIRRAKASLALQGKPVTAENLSLLLNIPSSKIERALQVKNRITSLDKTSNSYGLKMEFNGLHELVADRNSENQPWDALNEEHMIGNVRNRFRLLTSKEQEIIRWTFGIDTGGGAQSSLTAVGKKLGISKERVRQLKARALSKMRRREGDYSF